MTLHSQFGTRQYFDIDGGKVNVFRAGNGIIHKQGPTVVLEAGCGCSLLAFTWLQRSLAKRFDVFSYDRFGLGWSDEVKSASRDAEATADRLQRLLSTAQVTGPVILVGHSIASFYLRVFADKYPEQVRGLVLLDPCHPRQAEVLPTNGLSLWYKLCKRIMILYTQIGLANIVIPRWELRTNSMHFLPIETKHELLKQLCCAKSYATFFLEINAFNICAGQAALVKDLGNMPLLVITAPEPEINTPSDIDWDRYLRAWLYLHKEIASLSSDSRHKIISGAGHCTIITKHEFAQRVASEVISFIDEINL